MPKRLLLKTLLLGLTTSCLSISGLASAQNFPDRPITIVVPVPPGGLVDASARLLSEPLGRVTGQSIIIDNRQGASGNIAYQFVARSKPDGYTLLASYSGYHAANPLLMDKLTWDPFKDFTPIALLTVATNVIAVHPSVPVNNLKEFIAYAKANPGKLTVAVSSIASINHFMGELLKHKAGITWTEVHYRGNAPAINDLIAGHVDMGLQQLSDSLQHIQSGKLRALAVLGPKRAAPLPDVPTIGEAGYPDVQGITFNGIFAPKATPQPVIDKLSAAIRAALEKKATIDQLAALGSEARGNTPQEFRAFLEQETRKWSDVMKQANIKVTE